MTPEQLHELNIRMRAYWAASPDTTQCLQARRVVEDYVNAMLAAERAAERERFQVSVQTMRESKGESFMVCIDHPDRPLDAKPWDGGRMTPYSTPTRENAEMEAETWRRFFVSGDASHVNAMEAIRKLGEKRE